MIREPETLLPVAGGACFAGNLGTILSGSDGRLFIVPQSIKKNGYAYASVAIDGVAKQWEVHRLVAEAFIGACPIGHEVNHKDGDKLNNRPENLEYVTHQENMLHHARVLRPMRYRQLTVTTRARFPERDAEIIARLKSGMTQPMICREMGINKATLYRAIQRSKPKTELVPV